jgi:magnesium transporter
VARRRSGHAHVPANLHTPPGTITVPDDALPTVVTVFAYGPDRLEERTITRVEELDSLGKDWPVVWVNVEGLGDAALVKALGQRFGIHPLALEDVTDTTQRAKVEPYGDTTFVVVPMPHEDEKGFWTEQLSIIVTAGTVLTFQSMPGDCLGELRDRIRTARGRVRRSNAAYLSYAICDAVIDAYFPIVAAISDGLEHLEDDVLSQPSASQLYRIRRMRGDMLRIRRAVYPMRDAMASFAALDRVFDQDTRPYLRDLNDHIARLLDQVEMDRYLANDLIEMYMTTINIRLGETSKVLTIIATIFIPLSFIAGVYGMNFEFMPELHWAWGYPLALAAMALTALAFLWYFWRKGWLRDSMK